MAAPQALNEQLSLALARQLSRPDAQVTDVAFISIDRAGADVRLKRSGEICVERLGFHKVRPCAPQCCSAGRACLANRY